MYKLSPSASVSLARTTISTLPPLATSPVSSIATGALFVVIVIVTVPVAVPPLPSLTV